MKFKLPKALLVTLVSTLAANAAESDQYNYRPQAILDGTETAEIIKATLETAQETSTLEGRTAVIIDAAGNGLHIDQDVTSTTPIVVREGTVTVGNGKDEDSVSVTVGNTGSNYGARIVVAGKDASLVLNNANMATTKPGNGNNSMSVGGQDGDGKLTVTGGSSLYVQQAMFIGYESVPTLNNWTGSHVPGTFVSTDKNDGTLYCEVAPETKFENTKVETDGTRYATGKVVIEDGSQVEVGGGMYVGNATITVTGKDTILKVGTNTDSNSVWLSDFGKSELTISEGATFYSGKKFTTGDADMSEAVVTVKNATFTVANTVTLGCKDNASKAKISFESGANVQINNMLVGTNGSEASVDILSEAEYTGESVTIGADGRLTLSGSMSLTGALVVDGGTYIGTDGQFGGSVFTMLDGAVVEGLTMTTGTVNISGEVSLSNVTFGTVINAAGLMMLGGDDAALTVYIQQGSVINADDLNLGNGTNVAVVLDEGVIYEEGMELFTLTGSDSTQISELEAALGNNLAVYEYGNTEGEGTVVENATGSITTNVVPEPTTATLSLLALAGLAARRRRK